MKINTYIIGIFPYKKYAKNEDFNFDKCKTCGKNLCEDCHTFKQLENYLAKKQSEKNKFEGELITQMENRRFKAPCARY